MGVEELVRGELQVLHLVDHGEHDVHRPLAAGVLLAFLLVDRAVLGDDVGGDLLLCLLYTSPSPRD